MVEGHHPQEAGGVDETDLIRRILSGDPKAQTAFFNQNAPRLYPICVKFLGYGDPDAEDVVQETFIVAFRRLKDFEPRARLYTWLSHICVNLCFARLRKRRKTAATSGEDLDRLLLPRAEAVDQARSADEEDDKRRAILMASIASLDDRCRKVIELRDLRGLSYIETARELKVPIGTVMSQLARCREVLKKWIGRSAKDVPT